MSTSVFVDLPVADLVLPANCLPVLREVSGSDLFKIKSNKIYLVGYPPTGSHTVTVTLKDLHGRYQNQTQTYTLNVVECEGCGSVSNVAGS